MPENTAKVRISRVHLKGAAHITVLPTRPDPDQSNFVPTLVWLLDLARKGQVVGYAMVVAINSDDGSIKMIEAAKEQIDSDGNYMLGAIRRMEKNYIERTWPSGLDY